MERETQAKSIWKRSGLLVTVFLLGLMVHGSLFWLSQHPRPRTLMGDEIVYWSNAQRLAADAEPLHSYELWPPQYPRFLAALVSLFGPRRWVIEVFQNALLLVVILEIGDLTRAWTGSRLAGMAAAAMAWVYPPWAAFSYYFWPEILHSFLFLSAVWILARRVPSRAPGSSESSWRTAAWLITAGVLLGLAIESKSLLLPFLPVLLGLGLRGSFRRGIAHLALCTLGLGLVIVPPRLAGDRPEVVSNALAFNLWVGLNDHSRKERVDPIVNSEHKIYLESAETPRGRNAILWRKIQHKTRTDGVPTILARQLGRQYFRLFDHDSFLTRQLPAAHPSGAGYHDPEPHLAAFLRVSSFLLYPALLIGAVWGISMCPPHGRRWLWIAVLFLSYNLAILLFLHVKSRYRIQMMPFLFLYCGYAVAWLGTRLGWTSDPAALRGHRPSRRRLLVTGAGTALVLFLAYGGPLLDGWSGSRP